MPWVWDDELNSYTYDANDAAPEYVIPEPPALLEQDVNLRAFADGEYVRIRNANAAAMSNLPMTLLGQVGVVRVSEENVSGYIRVQFPFASADNEFRWYARPENLVRVPSVDYLDAMQAATVRDYQDAHRTREVYCDCGDGCIAGECPGCDYAADEYDDEYDDDPYNEDSGNDLILDHYFKPEPVFHGEGPTYMGMELEINSSSMNRYPLAEIAQDRLGSLAYLKEDSSVSGFEIVTHPMSFDYAMSDFPWAMLGELKRNGASTPPNETGIHVHVNRNGFSCTSHAYRWIKFVYRNRDDVTRIARRDTAEWAAFDRDARANVYHHVKDGWRGQHGRYVAVNTENRATFEVRIFASSLVERQVKAAFTLVAATVEYTRHLTARDVVQREGWQWKAFRAWFSERPEYQALIDEDQECLPVQANEDW